LVIIGIINKIAKQNGWLHIMPKYGFALKSKNITTTKQKYKHKNPSQDQNWNRGPLAPQFV